MKTSELTGSMLDYWTARAEGIPAEQLEIRRVQRSTEYHMVRTGNLGSRVLGYSTDWSQGGPLIEKYSLDIEKLGSEWAAYPLDEFQRAFGDTPLQAICRAVVRAAFGDEVPDIEDQP
jgi:hypothetical protein